MQVFILDLDVKKCAQYHCDRHIVKMPIESAQLLCITSSILGGPSPYKSQRWKNHPCAKWVLKSKQHSLWLLEHGKEICFIQGTGRTRCEAEWQSEDRYRGC